MTRRCTLPVDAPQTAEDRQLERWHQLKADALLLMAGAPGPWSVERLVKNHAGGPGARSGAALIKQVLDPLRELGLVDCTTPSRISREQQWDLTPAGRRAARREAQARADQAEREAQRQQFAIAGRREPLHPFERMPPTPEYRVQRPGAYAHEAWPSRYGDWLHYRDGRVVHVSERDA